MELRLYSFTNYYLSDMQKGIQTGHMAVDLVREYSFVNGMPPVSEAVKQSAMVADWADNWKTFIVLNGGNNASLKETVDLIKDVDLPWTLFCEDDQSLGGIMTCVGVVVPEAYFNAKIDFKSTYEGFPCTTITVGEGTPDGFYVSGDNPIVEEQLNSDKQNALFKFIKLIRTARLA
jgi:hypothetical protein